MRRRAWFLGRSDLFPVPGLKAICQWLGWIPLRIGRLDRDAFGKAVALIKQGKVVVIFPEGSRSQDGQLQSPKPGIGMIVAQTGCAVVPAYLKGTFDVLPPETMWPRFRPVTVFYGEALAFPRNERGRRCEAVLSGSQSHRDGSYCVIRWRRISDQAVQCRHSQG